MIMVTVASWGPNGLNGIHVHKPGCADTLRGVYRGPFVEEPWEVDVDSLKELVEEHYGPQAGSFYEESGKDADDPDAWRDYVGEFRVFPCVSTLPELPTDQGSAAWVLLLAVPGLLLALLVAVKVAAILSTVPAVAGQ